MEFTINFASQPYLQVQRFLYRWKLIVFGAALLTLALVSAALVFYISWRATQAEASELRRQITEQDQLRKQAEAFLNRPENWEVRVRAEFLNSAIARKAFSWTEVFSDLEKIMPPRLHVTSIQPQVNDEDQLELHLLVVGTARDAAIELVRRLAQPSHFEQARINDESMQRSQNKSAAGDSVQYSITAVYIPRFARGRTAVDKPVARWAAGPAGAPANADAAITEARNAGH